MDSKNTCTPCPVDISEKDILEAMAEIDGYLDITPADFILIYKISYQHAVHRLSGNVKARDVMSRKVIHVTEDASLKEAARIMAENNITGLPVVDHGSRLVGVLSEKDFFREAGMGTNLSFMAVISQCMNNSGCLVSSLNTRKVGDIMTAPAVTVTEDTPLSEVADILNTRKINRVPVIGMDSKLCGIVTRSDIVQSCFAKII